MKNELTRLVIGDRALHLRTQGDDVVVTGTVTEQQGERAVPSEALRRDLEEKIEREQRLEITAGRYGLSVEALLESLLDAAVDIHDPSGGLPTAERAALAEAGIRLDGSPDDPTGVRRVTQGRARAAALRRSSLTVAEAARRLGVSGGRVRQLIAAGELVSLGGDGAHLLPDWQFVDGAAVPGLAQVTAALTGCHPLTVAGFMTTPSPDLEAGGVDLSPVEWLVAGGDVTPVAELAVGLRAAA